MKATFFLLVHKTYGGGSSNINEHWDAAKAAKLPMFLFNDWIYTTKSKEQVFYLYDLIEKSPS